MKRQPRSTAEHARGPSARPGALVAALALTMLGSAAHAVVLGKVQVQSHLGQPLVAEVELLGADKGSLNAELASPSVYKQHGVELPHQLGKINVKMLEKRGGRRVLRLTSERPVSEPALELLLQAQDRNGGILRKMPVLLDPAPTAEAKPARVAVQDNSPAATSGVRLQPPAQVKTTASSSPSKTKAKAKDKVEARAERPRKAPAAALAKAPPKSRSTSAMAGVESTAQRATPDPMVTLGGVPQVTGAVSSTAAATGVAAETVTKTALAPSAASGTAPSMGVNPAATASSASVSGTATIDQGAGALVQAERAAQTTTPSMATQSTATDSSTALSPGSAASDTASATDASRTGLSAALPSLAGASAAPAGASAPMAASIADTTDSSATQPNDKPVVTSPGTDDDSGFPWTGTALAAGGGLLAWWLWRRRRADAADFHAQDSIGAPIIFGGADDAALPGAGANRPQAARAKASGATDFRLSAVHMLEDVDPIAEADVYIAYGRVNEARSILEDALHAQPDRAALHLKMLGIEFEQRDVRAFNERAQTLAALTDRQGPEWEEVTTLGQRLEPDNPLFSKRSPLAQAEPDAPPMDLDIGAPSSQLSLEPITASPSLPDGVGLAMLNGRLSAGSTAQHAAAPVETPASVQARLAPDAVPAPDRTNAPAPLDFSLSDLQAYHDGPNASPVAAVDLSRALDALSGAGGLDSGGGASLDMPLTDLAKLPGSAVESGHSLRAGVESDSLMMPSYLDEEPTAVAALGDRVGLNVGADSARTLPRPGVPRGADTSRFDVLPAKLALVQQLSDAGNRSKAADLAREVAQLIAQLRSEASLIASLADRRG